MLKDVKVHMSKKWRHMAESEEGLFERGAMADTADPGGPWGLYGQGAKAA